MMPETSANHGQKKGLEKVRSKLRAQKLRSVRVPHREIPLSLGWGLNHAFDTAEYDAIFMGSSRSKVQSGNLVSHPPTSSHAVALTPATAWNGNIPLTRTLHFCRSHIHLWKEPLYGIHYLGMCPAEHDMSHNADSWRQPKLIHESRRDAASRSSLSSGGLALLVVAHQS